ncbi:MAG: SO_0444 family Cu/Zn efflux transporter [Desulfamplus sp.]|nr:SO_0444 family Cu/Zn efflux transporter [Desulfamplus sp.]
MFETVMKIAVASWDVLLESAIFVLFGFFMAGVLKAFIPDDFIQKHLGGDKASGVFKASLFGIPIPLCSCGVVPAAAGLKEQGASKGAIASFMIATPETGVDSIAVTYALLDPVMTIMRPVAAFFTASFTGIAVNLFDKNSDKLNMEKISITEESKIDCNTSLLSCSEEGGCSCSCSLTIGLEKKGDGNFWDKFRGGMSFAFGELLGDIGSWLLIGVGLAGVITVFITPDFIESYLGDGIFSMFVMIAIATPLYVCATSSTPIAAALALKGLSPGAALVFLLAGPATNVATITVLSKFMGNKITAIYLVSIMGCSLFMGIITNWLYKLLGLDITGWVQSNMNEEHGVVSIAAALLLLILVIKPIIKKRSHKHHTDSHSHNYKH